LIVRRSRKTPREAKAASSEFLRPEGEGNGFESFQHQVALRNGAASWRDAKGRADALGGTSVLIVVGVALDTMRQMDSQLLERRHEGSLKS
jgi:hypothetical protein